MRISRLCWALLAVVCLGMIRQAGAESHPALRFYIGTYSRGLSKGIYFSSLDVTTGRLAEPQLAAVTDNPSFLALHPDVKRLYAVNETAEYQGKPGGSISAFDIQSDGALKLINAQPTAGAAPCHASVDPSGRCAMIANYTGGSIAAYPIDAAGSLQTAATFIQYSGIGANPKRQNGPHAHSINLDPAAKFVLVTDLGLDKVLSYRLDPAAARLTPADPPFTKVDPVSGPRHLDFHPSGKFVYVINEIACTVTAMSYDPERGSATVLQTLSTLPDGKPQPGYSTADIHVHPSGKFLYGSNRGHNTLALFRIDPATGKLAAVGHFSTGGKTPRNFAIDPTGRYIIAANQASDNLVLFRIDPQSGALTPAGSQITVGFPVCIRFVNVK